MTADELTEFVKRIKREVAGAVPVTTGEIYSELLETNKDGELVAEKLISKIDYIAAHVLPYWGGIPAEGAVDEAVRVYDLLRTTFPGKRIVIAEFGWPSAGYNRKAADPGKLEQARLMRYFVARAQALGIDYNIIEAFDQPWKSFEGSVGAYWGLFDNAREPKFAWTGPIADGDRWKIATIAVAVGILVSLPILGIAGATLTQAALLAVAAHVVGAWAATVFDYWDGHYFVFGSAFALGSAPVLLIPLVLIALRADRRNRRHPVRARRRGACCRQRAADPAPGSPPKVSIHIPAYMEPPDMLKATLDAVARLAYPNFECIIVINNTPDRRCGRPDRGALPRARRTLQIRQCAEARRLQGGRAAARAGPHRSRRRDHRHHRFRLCRQPGLAERPGAAVRRSAGRAGAGAAGPSRRRRAARSTTP